MRNYITTTPAEQAIKAIQVARDKAALELTEQVLARLDSVGADLTSAEEYDLAKRVWEGDKGISQVLREGELESFEGCQRLLADLMSQNTERNSCALKYIETLKTKQFLFLICQLNALAPAGWAPMHGNQRTLPEDVCFELMKKSTRLVLSQAVAQGLWEQLKTKKLTEAKQHVVVSLFRYNIGRKGGLRLSDAMKYNQSIINPSYGYISNPAMEPFQLCEEGSLNPAVSTEQQWDEALSRERPVPYQVPCAPLSISLEILNQNESMLRPESLRGKDKALFLKTDENPDGLPPEAFEHPLVNSWELVYSAQQLVNRYVDFGENTDAAASDLAFNREVKLLISRLSALETAIVRCSIQSAPVLPSPLALKALAHSHYIRTSAATSPCLLIQPHLDRRYKLENQCPVSDLSQLTSDDACCFLEGGSGYIVNTSVRPKQIYYYDNGAHTYRQVRWTKDADIFLNNHLSTARAELTTADRRDLDIYTGANTSLYYYDYQTRQCELVSTDASALTVLIKYYEGIDTSVYLNPTALSDVETVVGQCRNKTRWEALSAARIALLEIHQRLFAYRRYVVSKAFNNGVLPPIPSVTPQLAKEACKIAKYKKEESDAIEALTSLASVWVVGEGYGLYYADEDPSALSLSRLRECFGAYEGYLYYRGEVFYFNQQTCEKIEKDVEKWQQFMASAVGPTLGEFRLTTPAEYKKIRTELQAHTSLNSTYRPDVMEMHSPGVACLFSTGAILVACLEGMNRSELILSAVRLLQREGTSKVQGEEKGYHPSAEACIDVTEDNFIHYIHGEMLACGEKGETIHQNYLNAFGHLKGTRELGEAAHGLYLNPLVDRNSNVNIASLPFVESHRQLIHMAYDEVMTTAILQAAAGQPQTMVFFARGARIAADTLIRLITGLGFNSDQCLKVKENLQVICVNAGDTLSRAGGRNEVVSLAAAIGNPLPFSGVPQRHECDGQRAIDLIATKAHLDGLDMSLGPLLRLDTALQTVAEAAYEHSKTKCSLYLEALPPEMEPSSLEVRDKRQLARNAEDVILKRHHYLLHDCSSYELGLEKHEEEGALLPRHAAFLEAEMTSIRSRMTQLQCLPRWCYTTRTQACLADAQAMLEALDRRYQAVLTQVKPLIDKRSQLFYDPRASWAHFYANYRALQSQLQQHAPFSLAQWTQIYTKFNQDYTALPPLMLELDGIQTQIEDLRQDYINLRNANLQPILNCCLHVWNEQKLAYSRYERHAVAAIDEVRKNIDAVKAFFSPVQQAQAEKCIKAMEVAQRTDLTLQAKELLFDLQAYVDRIDGLLERNQGLKYAYFQSIQVRNREGNYVLAKYLIERLKNRDDYRRLFADRRTLTALRREHSPTVSLFSRIRSNELNQIIQKAQGWIAVEKRSGPCF